MAALPFWENALQVGAYRGKKVLLAFIARGTAFGPRSSRMKHIPRRALLMVSTLAWVMVAKTIDYSIPDRHEFADEHRLAERNPNIVNHEVATLKIRKVQVLGLLDGLGMLVQAIVKHLPRRDIQAEAAFPRAGGHGLVLQTKRPTVTPQHQECERY